MYISTKTLRESISDSLLLHHGIQIGSDLVFGRILRKLWIGSILRKDWYALQQIIIPRGRLFEIFAWFSQKPTSVRPRPSHHRYDFRDFRRFYFLLNFYVEIWDSSLLVVEFTAFQNYTRSTAQESGIQTSEPRLLLELETDLQRMINSRDKRFRI